MHSIGCSDNPALAHKLISQGRMLGVQVINGVPEIQGKDATYKARYGKPGVITVGQRLMTDQARCQLITHEFIHFLQHLNGDLKQVKELGWPIKANYLDIFGSIQEAEAYSHQEKAGEILGLLRYLK